MAATHTRSRLRAVTDPTELVDDSCTQHVPGEHVAALLFDRGLWFEAVVRGLRVELGFSDEQATFAATAAGARRMSGARTV